jgi:hypothetical protein
MAKPSKAPKADKAKGALSRDELAALSESDFEDSAGEEEESDNDDEEGDAQDGNDDDGDASEASGDEERREDASTAKGERKSEASESEASDAEAETAERAPVEPEHPPLPVREDNSRLPVIRAADSASLDVPSRVNARTAPRLRGSASAAAATAAASTDERESGREHAAAGSSSSVMAAAHASSADAGDSESVILDIRYLLDSHGTTLPRPLCQIHIALAERCIDFHFRGARSSSAQRAYTAQHFIVRHLHTIQVTSLSIKHGRVLIALPPTCVRENSVIIAWLQHMHSLAVYAADATALPPPGVASASVPAPNRSIRVPGPEESELRSEGAGAERAVKGEPSVSLPSQLPRPAVTIPAADAAPSAIADSAEENNDAHSMFTRSYSSFASATRSTMGAADDFAALESVNHELLTFLVPASSLQQPRSGLQANAAALSADSTRELNLDSILLRSARSAVSSAGVSAAAAPRAGRRKSSKRAAKPTLK